LTATALLARSVRASLRHPRAVLCVWLGLAALASAGVLRIEVETSTDTVLDRRDPAWSFYRGSVERFGGDEIVVIALSGDEPYAAEVLAEVARIDERLEGAPGVRRVDSVASFPVVELLADGSLRLDPALDASAPLDSRERARVAARVAADRILPGLLVSRDGRSFGIAVRMQELGEAVDAQVVAAVREAVGERAAWISGGPVFRTETSRLVRSQVLTLVPITVALVLLLYRALFGSLRMAWIPLASSGMGCWLQLGAMGALGVPLAITTVILPSVLLAMGCAYVTHLLTAAGEGGALGRAELLDRLPPVLEPIAISATTTAIGFASMASVQIDVIRWVGLFGAFGTAVLFLASATLAPALLALRPRGVRAHPLSLWLARPGAARLARLCAQRRGWLLAAWLGAAGVALVFARDVEFETDVILYFPRGSPVRDDYAAIRERLSGISPMNVVIGAPEGRSVTEPAVVRAMGQLAQALEARAEVGRALSLADPLIQLQRGFSGSDALPESQAAIEQFLLLLESVDHVRDLVTGDRRQASVVLRLDDNGSNDLLRIAEVAERWWRQHGPAGFSARVTGIMYEYARSERELERGQVGGLSTALAVVGGIFALAFRSLRVALIGLVPNVVSLALAFGGMGLLGVPLDAGTVFVGSLALGIAVDDTLHVVAAYERARRRGLAAQAALECALSETLPAVVYTSSILAAGFSVLLLSDFALIQNLGLGTACAMLICLLAGALLLPPLLLSFRGDRGSRAPGPCGGASSSLSTAFRDRPKQG